jgi:colicin import membrane protein
LQQFQFREPLRHPSEKGKGVAGTILIHAAIIALLIFVSFTVPPPPEQQEGILVNFGTDETGFGDIEPSPPAGPTNLTASQPVHKETAPPPSRPKAAARQSGEAPMISQDGEDAPEVKKADPNAAKKKLEKTEADKKKREEQIEADRIARQEKEAQDLKDAQEAAAEKERQRVEAEKQAQQQRLADIQNKTKNALANSRNSGTSSTSEGIAGGTGNQGDPRGSVDSKVRGVGGGTGTSGTGTGNQGISYSLTGRNFQKLPNPVYDYQGEGKVAVEVQVDRTGKVTQATAGVKGSTTLDEPLLKAAHDAAMNARFDAKPDAPVFQKGTIIYTFILK